MVWSYLVFQQRQSQKWKMQTLIAFWQRPLTTYSWPERNPYHLLLARINLSLISPDGQMDGWMSAQPGKTKTVSSVAFLPAFVSFNKCFWYSDTQPGQHLQIRHLVWITLKSKGFFYLYFVTIQPSLFTPKKLKWLLQHKLHMPEHRLSSHLSIMAITFFLITANPFSLTHNNSDSC